jgi:5-methylthioadenosine/S-adenosylhomocysteine deaminase
MRFDTAIVGATLLTGDEAKPVIRDGVLGISVNRFCFVGARSALPDLSAARLIDAAGRLITPGFINVHTHAVLSLMRGIALDMGFAPAYTRGVPCDASSDSREGGCA